MKIVEQSIELMEEVDGEALLWKIEAAARNCYKSEFANAERDPVKRDVLIRRVVSRGHDSVLEHAAVTFRVICNRGVSHEWVRHRVGCSYSQESTRYCNYGHAGEITVIWPWYLGDYQAHYNNPTPSKETYIRSRWIQAMWEAQQSYLDLLEKGCKPEEARDVLPTCLKTEMIITMNFRSIRHFIHLRKSPDAHPQIRELAAGMLEIMKKIAPVVFDDMHGRD